MFHKHVQTALSSSLWPHQFLQSGFQVYQQIDCLSYIFQSVFWSLELKTVPEDMLKLADPVCKCTSVAQYYWFRKLNMGCHTPLNVHHVYIHLYSLMFNVNTVSFNQSFNESTKCLLILKDDKKELQFSIWTEYPYPFHSGAKSQTEPPASWDLPRGCDMCQIYLQAWVHVLFLQRF